MVASQSRVDFSLDKQFDAFARIVMRATQLWLDDCSIADPT